jgi:hypothetical protein
VDHSAWTYYNSWTVSGVDGRSIRADAYNIQKTRSIDLRPHEDDLVVAWNPMPAPERPMSRDIWIITPPGMPNELLTKPGLVVVYYRIKYVNPNNQNHGVPNNTTGYAGVASPISSSQQESKKQHQQVFSGSKWSVV